MPFSFFLLLCFFAVLFIAGFAIIPLRAFKLGFALGKAQSELTASARGKYLEWRWDFGLAEMLVKFERP